MTVCLHASPCFAASVTFNVANPGCLPLWPARWD